MTMTTSPTPQNQKSPNKFAKLGARSVIYLAIAAQISGCISMPRTASEPNVDTIRSNLGSAGPVPGGADLGVIDVDAGYESEDMFLLRPLTSPGKLPAKQIAPFDLNQSGIFDTLRILIEGTGLTLKIEGGLQGSEAYGSATMFDVQGSLTEVIENLSESMGFFWSVRKNTLLIQPEQQFVVALPPALADDNTASLTNTLQFLGARETYIDRMAGTLVFKANRTALAKIEPYLNTIRETRSMIVYAINIFQVDLKDNSELGIQWNRLGWTGPGAGMPGAATAGAGAGAGAGSGAVNTGTGTTLSPGGGVQSTGTPVGDAASAVTSLVDVGKSLQAGISGSGLGVVLSTARFTIDNLINFLKTQGTVQTLSQPRIAIMNNTIGTLSVGRTTTYISRIGTTYSTSLNQITTETKDLETGIDIQVKGQTSDNTVITSLDMKVIDLISLTPVVALGTNAATPDVAKRKANQIIRTSPGEMFVMGGITLTRDSRNDTRGVANNGRTMESTKSELVLALRTQIIRFLPKGEKAKRDAAKRRAEMQGNDPFLPPTAPSAPASPAPVQRSAPRAILSEGVVIEPPRRQMPPPRVIQPAPAPATTPSRPMPAEPPSEPLRLRMSEPGDDFDEKPAIAKAGSTKKTAISERAENLLLKFASQLSAGSLESIALIKSINERYFPIAMRHYPDADRRRAPAEHGQHFAIASLDRSTGYAPRTAQHQPVNRIDAAAMAALAEPELRLRSSDVAMASNDHSGQYRPLRTPARYTANYVTGPDDNFLSMGRGN